MTFDDLLFNDYQNSNMVLDSQHNTLDLLLLPLLQLSSVIKHYLMSFKTRNRAKSNFSITMSLFKLTAIIVRSTPSSSNRGKQRGYSSQEYDNCCILLEESQQKHLQVCMLQLTWTLHFLQHWLCQKHIPMSPGTFVSIQMNLCNTKMKLKKNPTKHTATWPPTTTAQ